MTEQYKDIARILAGAVFISFSSVWVAWSGTDPLISAFYRVFFGSFFLLCACLLGGGLRPVPVKTLLYSLLCGLCFAGDLYCWHLSILHVGPGLATILPSFQVFVLAALSLLLFGQQLRIAFLVSLPLAFVGLFLIVGVNWQSLPASYRLGVFFGLVTALLYACFILLLRKIQQLDHTISFFQTLLLVSLATSLVLGPLGLAAGKSFALAGLRPLLCLVCLALFSQTIGWAFITASLPRVLPSLAGLILLLQPTLAFLWDVLLFGRPTSALQWTGVTIVLAAIYLGTGALGRGR